MNSRLMAEGASFVFDGSQYAMQEGGELRMLEHFK